MKLFLTDEERIDILKNYYDLDKTSELVRFVLRKEADTLRRGRIKFEVKLLRNVLNKEGKNYEWGTIEHDGKTITDVFFKED